jgi:hypothetical protein
MTDGLRALSRAEGIEAYAPTLRDRFRQFLTPFTGYESARDIAGTGEDFGVADLSPAGMLFAAQEGSRTVGRGLRSGDPLTTGLGAAEVFLSGVPIPGARVARRAASDGVDALAEFARTREAMFAAPRDADLETLMRLSSSAAEARDRAVSELMGEVSSSGGVRLVQPETGRRVAVSPGLSGDEVGRFRLTFVDEAGDPTNHVVYNTPEEALGDALRQGYVQPSGSRTAVPEQVLDPLPAPRTSSEQVSDEVARLLREGRSDEVSDAMLSVADDRRLTELYRRGEVGMDLPMDEASRMARARELRFTESEFVGTMEPNIRQLDPRMARGERRFSGSYSSDNPYLASSYADPNLGSVYPLLTRGMPEDAIRFDAQGGLWNRLSGTDSLDVGGREVGPMSIPLVGMGETPMRGDFTTNQVGRMAFMEGRSGAEFQNVVDRGPFAPNDPTDPAVRRTFQQQGAEPSTVRARQDTRGVRSRFARFDPRLQDLRNLMAGGAGLAVGLSMGEEVEDGPAVRNYRDGGPVMMRSSMPAQLEGGIGNLIPKARDMYDGPRGVGAFAQYMRRGGEASRFDPQLESVRERVRQQSGVDPVQIAAEEGLDPGLFLRMIRQESGGRATARSPKDAFGFTQLMPATARELGVDRNDPVDNLRGGARYLRQQLDTFGEVPLALAAYNAGPGAVRRHGGIPPFRETQNYVASILGGGFEGSGSVPRTLDSSPRPEPRPEFIEQRFAAEQGAPMGPDPLMAFGQQLAAPPPPPMFPGEMPQMAPAAQMPQQGVLPPVRPQPRPQRFADPLGINTRA